MAANPRMLLLHASRVKSAHHSNFALRELKNWNTVNYSVHQQNMNTKFDSKSALLGLGLGVLATLALGAGSSSNQVGRYQINGTANQGMVIDTATGQVWAKYFPYAEGVSDADFFKPKK